MDAEERKDKTKFIELLEDVWQGCQEDRLLDEIKEDDLRKTVRSVIDISNQLYDQVCETVIKYLDYVEFPMDREELDDETEDAICRVIYDALWSATFD